MPTFEAKEKVIGYVDTDSGHLLICDGVWADSLPKTSSEKILMDMERDEPIRIPVLAFQKNGRRFLVIDLDGGSLLKTGETVVTEGTLPGYTEEKENEEEKQEETE